jgi:hypothetical protein
MTERTKHQQKIIKNYYNNREAIAWQRVQELITELYLTTGKKRDKHWESLALHLERLGVKQEQIDHLVGQDKPELVAKFMEKMMAG